MPVIDLGPVVGPQGAQGNTGPQGPQGVAGPSLISAETQTSLNGALAGDGSVVGVRTIDTTPNATHTTNLITSAAVANAIAYATETHPLNNTVTLESIKDPGFYYWTGASQSPSDVPFTYGYMLLMRRGATTYEQICFNTLGAIAIRNIYVGTASPWYWVAGCPMANGVEYATAELFNGKTVYCQMKSVGNVTANTATTVVFASGLSASGRIIRTSVHGIRSGNANNVLSAPYDDGTLSLKANALYYANNGNWSARVGILSNQDLTNVFASAWYTKE